jgi:predicted DNA-binding transcriptional regulator AlpA
MPAPLVATEDQILTLREFATTARISISTVRRRIADGTGPKIIRLSDRRVGVRLGDYRAWLDKRTKAHAAST